jgi:hypothetical protein
MCLTLSIVTKLRMVAEILTVQFSIATRDATNEFRFYLLYRSKRTDLLVLSRCLTCTDRKSFISTCVWHLQLLQNSNWLL